MKKKILIIRSNPVAPDPRVDKIAAALSEAGYEVNVLGWDRTGSLPRFEQRDSYMIERLLIRANYGAGLGNLPQLIRWQFGLFAWLISHLRTFDSIHACDFDTIVPAYLCKLFWHKKVVYDIFDFYADHLRRTPDWINNIIRGIDLKIINRVDAVILVDDSRKQQIARSAPRRLSIVYNSPDETSFELIHTQNRNDLYKLKIAYIGLLQKERGIYEILQILQRHPDWHLDIAGFGGDEDEIIKTALSIPNVIFHGRIPYRKTIELSSAADVLFATYDPVIPNHRFSSPNKLFEAMMLGKPIIVAKNTNMDKIVAEQESGLVVNYGDVQEFEGALARLAENPAERLAKGKNARKAYQSIYSWSIMKKRLIELYADVFADTQQD